MTAQTLRVTRRQFAAGIGAGMALGHRTAFGQTPAPSDSVVSLDPATSEALGAPAVPTATLSTAAEATSFQTAFAPYANYGTDVAPGIFPREILHAFGSTLVETKPERVVTLDAGELDACVSMGIIPVGAVEYTRDSMASFSRERVGDIPLVGTLEEPDIEAILGLGPDLLLSSKLRHDQALFDRFSAIGPTVFSNSPGVTFKLNFKLYAQSLGRESEAAAFIRRYEDGVRAANMLLPNPRPTTSIVQIRPAEVRYYQRANFLGTVLTDLGFPRNAPENVDDFAFIGTEENLLEYASGKFIILAVVGGDENESANAILASDVWKTLPAVQSDNVLTADSNTFIGGVGYGAAGDVVNTVAGYFGIDPVIVHP